MGNPVVGVLGDGGSKRKCARYHWITGETLLSQLELVGCQQRSSAAVIATRDHSASTFGLSLTQVCVF